MQRCGFNLLKRDDRTAEHLKIGDEEIAHLGAEEGALDIHQLPSFFLVLPVFQKFMHDKDTKQDLQRDGGQMQEKFEMGKVFEN